MADPSVPAPSDLSVSPRSRLRWQRALPAVVVGTAIGLLALNGVLFSPVGLALIGITVYGALFAGGDSGSMRNPPPSGKRPLPPPAPPAPSRSQLGRVLPGILVGTAALGLLAAFGFVTPYAAALPMFLLAGTLSGDGKEHDPADTFHRSLVRRLSNGEYIGTKELEELGAAAGLTPSKLDETLEDLGAQGFIARLDIPDGAPVRVERTTLSEGHHTLWGPADLVLEYIVSVTRIS